MSCRSRDIETQTLSQEVRDSVSTRANLNNGRIARHAIRLEGNSRAVRVRMSIIEMVTLGITSVLTWSVCLRKRIEAENE